MSDGGILVTKVTTGTHYIEDIQILVHHQVPTLIPAEKAVNSRDLYRAISARILFQLSNNMVHNQPAPPVLTGSREAQLEVENRVLREALAKSNQQGDKLEATVQTLGQQVQALVGAVQKLVEAPPQVVHVAGGQAAATPLSSEVVGGETPMFLPDTMVPSDAKVQVQLSEQSSEGNSVSEAANKLRQLKKGKQV